MFRRPSFNRRHRISQNSSPYHRKRSPSRPSGIFALSPKPTRVSADTRPDVIPKRTPRDLPKHNPVFDFQQVTHIENEDSESDESGFRWDSEATLWSDLLEEGPMQPDAHDIDELTGSLQDSFKLKGRRMKGEIAQTLVGTHNHVKVIYQLLDETIDPSFGRGVSIFNKACKVIEQTVQLEQVDFESAYTATQRKIQALFEELRSEYEARDKLWAAVKKSLDDIVTPAIERVQDTPARVERTIVKLEKHDKSLGNTSADMETVSKSLQQLLKAA